MAEAGVFVDVLARLNSASVNAVAREVERIFGNAGKAASRAFEQNATLGSASAMFSEMQNAATVAYRQMQAGAVDLQVQESRLNEMRVASYKRTTDEIVAQQARVDAALLNTQKLIETSNASQAALVAGGRGGGGDDDRRRPRGDVIPTGGRAGAVAGIGSLAGLAAIVGEGTKIASEVQANLNQIQALQGLSSNDIKTLQDSVYNLSQKTGYSARDISKAYQTVERNPKFRSPAASQDVMENALKLARVRGTSPEIALEGLMTSANDFNMSPSAAAAQLAAAGASNRGDSSDFFNSLHTIEPSAMLAGLKPADIYAALGIASQTGQTNQQSAQNLSQLTRSLASPNSQVVKALGQLNLNPQDLSLQLSQKGLPGTLNEIMTQIAKDTGPNGVVTLNAMTQNALLGEQQKTVLGQMSPAAQALTQTQPFQSGAESPLFLRADYRKGKLPGLNDQDLQLLSTWEKQQQGLNSANQYLQQNKPSEQSVLAATGSAFGTQDAGRMAMILGGSPEAMQNYQNQSNQINGQTAPGAFQAQFEQAMTPLKVQLETLKSTAGALSGRIGSDLLPVMQGVVNGFKDVLDFLGQHKTIGATLLAGMGAVAAWWTGAKLINAGEEMVGAFSKVKGAFGWTTDMASKMGGAVSEFQAGTTGAATTLEGGATTASGELAAAGKGLDTGVAAAGTSLETGAATAGGELAAGGAAAASTLEADAAAAGGTLMGGISGILSKAGELFAPAALGMELGKGAHDYAQSQESSDARRVTDAIGQGPSATKNLPPDWASKLGIPGKARGGIIGYKDGTWHAGEQPLLDQPDMGGDSILGTVNGMPIALRGGEGILTPDAVRRVGGKHAIDSLNSGGDNPWSDPLSVGTQFYSSFAHGVAKYSPWGKYLAANADGLSAMAKEFEDSTKTHEGSGKRGAMPQMNPDGSWPTTESGGPKDKNKIVDMAKQVYMSMGLPADQWRDFEHIVSKESGWNPGATNPKSGAYGLGQMLGSDKSRYYTKGAAPDQQIAGTLQYIMDRYGSPAAAWKYWQGHNAYRRGGVVGYDGGGIVGYAGGTDNVQAPAPPGFPAPNGGGSLLGNTLGVKPNQPPPQGDKPAASVPGGPPNRATPGPKDAAASPPPQGASVPHPAPAAPPPGTVNTPGLKTAPGTPAGAFPGTEGRGGESVQKNPSRQEGMDNKSPGWGISSGGLIGTAESVASTAASAAANMGAPGAGSAASAASNMAFQLINRAIGYGGQLVGIGAEGLMETFLPNDSPLGDPSSNILGKVALGVAGAHPGPANRAGQSAQPMQPKDPGDPTQGGQGKMLPAATINIGNITNNTGNHGETVAAVNKGMAMHSSMYGYENS